MGNQWYSNVLPSMSDESSKLYGVKIFFFELFDEDEKQWKNNKVHESHFGIYDKNGNMKLNNLNLLTDGVTGGPSPARVQSETDDSETMDIKFDNDHKTIDWKNIALIVTGSFFILLCALFCGIRSLRKIKYSDVAEAEIVEIQSLK